MADQYDTTSLELPANLASLLGVGGGTQQAAATVAGLQQPPRSSPIPSYEAGGTIGQGGLPIRPPMERPPHQLCNRD